MNLTDYSLQKLAQGYLLQRSLDARAIRLVTMASSERVAARHWDQFALLLQSWLRLTSLLVRYPMNPARVSGLLVSVGFPVAGTLSRRPRV
ncbi:MAG TPA: hypothetical protein VMW69_14225 [Spirochaetia bacterium]|nr:hypothetical protein [Spirochaetia bacterium]